MGRGTVLREVFEPIESQATVARPFLLRVMKFFFVLLPVILPAEAIALSNLRANGAIEDLLSLRFLGAGTGRCCA